MQIHVDQRREILLSGGMNLQVSSNDPDVVPNDGFAENMSRSDGLRSLWPFGRSPGVSMLAARCGCSLVCFLQIQVGLGPVADSEAGPDEEFQIVLSPTQFAAVLEGATLNEKETSSNRLWGGLAILGGALELVGAAALLLTPEPTMVTKVAGGVLGVHGADTISTGIDQLISGRPQTTLTAQAAEAAARSMGVDPDGAVKVGMAVDIAVPLIAGFAGAARIIAVRRGVISLAAEEAAGGHTIARHVGRTEAQLLARLTAQPGIKAASTFRTIAEAEQTISAALRAQSGAIKAWASTAKVGATKAIPFNAGRTIGQGVVRATGQLTNMSGVTVVVRKVAQANRIYFVLTAYPKL